MRAGALVRWGSAGGRRRARSLNALPTHLVRRPAAELSKATEVPHRGSLLRFCDADSAALEAAYRWVVRRQRAHRHYSSMRSMTHSLSTHLSHASVSDSCPSFMIVDLGKRTWTSFGGRRRLSYRRGTRSQPLPPPLLRQTRATAGGPSWDATARVWT
jgi:hypothetical protein